MSAVDVTKPIEGEATTASVRANFVAIKTELETAEAHYVAANPHPQYTTTAEAAAAAPVQSVAGKTGAVTLVKADVGLSNVDNKSSAAIRSEITASDIATPAHAANAKATPVDADELTGLDSAASFGLIRVTWVNIKATLKAYFDTVYQSVLGANFSWNQSIKRLTITGANTVNSNVIQISSCGAGDGVANIGWGAGGYLQLGDVGAKANLAIVNHKGMGFAALGSGDASGIFIFDADTNAVTSGGPLIAFWKNGGRVAEIHTDGRYSAYGSYTNASNYERGTFKVDTTNGLTITHEALGTGATRNVNISFGASARLNINAVGVRCDAPLYPNTAAQSLGLSSNYWGTAFLTVAKMNVFTVATLPSAATSGAGTRSFVSDALAPTFGATVAAGGAVSTPVYSDGTDWKVG